MPENKGGNRRFEEHDIPNLQKMVTDCQNQIKDLSRSDSQRGTEETLYDEINKLQRRLQVQNSELKAFKRNQDDKEKELAHHERQLEEYQLKFEDRNGELQRIQATVGKFQKAISEVENKIFGAFCKRLGYEDIKAYNAQQGSLDQEAAQKRQDYRVQKETIQNNLKWMKSQLDSTEKRAKGNQENLARIKNDLAKFQRDKSDIEKALGADQDELNALQDTLEELRAEHAEKAKKVAEAKQELQKRNKDIDGRLKEISTLEATVQKNSVGKLALLRRCKLEQIQIPLNAGSLDNIPNEDVLLRQDQDAMDLDGEDEDAEAEILEAALDDYGIEIDFDNLEEDLRNVSPARLFGGLKHGFANSGHIGRG